MISGVETLDGKSNRADPASTITEESIVKSLLAALLFVLPAIASAQVRVGTMLPQIEINVEGGPGTVAIDYDEAVKVADLVDLLSEVSGKNVMYKSGADPKQTVRFFARGTFPKSEVYELIVSALSTVDLRLEHHGRYIRLYKRVVN